MTALPGIGQRTAQRLAVSLSQWPRGKREAFLSDLEGLRDLATCPLCGLLANAGSCRACKEGKDATRFAVVALPEDVLALEAAGLEGMAFHCLGGLVSPGKGVEESHLHLAALAKRMGEGTEEVLLAFGAGLEADLTADAVRRVVPPDIPVTRLATGLPVGADLAHVDLLTIRRSIEGRSRLA